MKKVSKGLIGFAVLMLAAGAILTGAGWAMGGETSMTVNLAGHEVNVGIHSPSVKNGEWAWTAENTVVAEDLAAFDKLDIDLSLADVYVIPSDHYGVDLSWYGKNYALQYTNEGGTLKVWSNSTPNIGINLSANYGGTVTVYLPEGVKLDDVAIKTNMGEIDLRGFDADTLNATAHLGDVSLADTTVGDGFLTLDLGDLSVNTVTADTLDLTLSLGDLEAYDLTTAKELTVVNHMGGVSIEGAFGGRTDVTDDMGDVDITTSLPRRDCGYDLKTSMGSVYVDGAETGDKAKSTGGTHTITVNNSMGDIDLAFN